MNTLILSCVIIGGLLSLISGLMLLVQAFRANILWGLAVIFVPFAGLVFIITHWDDTKKWFGLNLVGLAIVIAPILFVTPTGESEPLYVRLMRGYAEDGKKPAQDGENAPLEEGETTATVPETAPTQGVAPETAAAPSAAAATPASNIQALIDQKNAELLNTHAQLQAERSSLDTQNAQAVANFNQKAADYEKQRQELVILKQQQQAQSKPQPAQ